jgi:hypothetical protein
VGARVHQKEKNGRLVFGIFLEFIHIKQASHTRPVLLDVRVKDVE